MKMPKNTTDCIKFLAAGQAWTRLEGQGHARGLGGHRAGLGGRDVGLLAVRALHLLLGAIRTWRAFVHCTGVSIALPS